MINKKLLKSFVALSSVATLATTFIPTSTVLAAEAKQDPETIIAKENESDYYVKNDLYLQFEKEMAELLASKENNISTYSSEKSPVTEEEVFQLIDKYEGAEVTVLATGVSHSLVNGGVNSFATNKTAMKTLANTYTNNANIAVAGGTLVGLPLGVFGALVAAFSSGALASKFTNAANIMNSWYSSSATQGGVRLTLTETFAISSASSTAKATIP